MGVGGGGGGGGEEEDCGLQRCVKEYEVVEEGGEEE